MLKNRIKSLIALIEDTQIEEIEVSSFWGAQKIRLSKNKPVKSIDNISVNESVPPSSLESSKLPEKNIGDTLEVNKKTDQSFDKKDDKIETKVDLEVKLEEDIDYYEIKAPLVGTFYSSPKPSDPPFVNVGDKITKGQVICIIEAMKIFNDIESEITGTVHEVCVESGSPVEYDQVIIKILPE